MTAARTVVLNSAEDLSVRLKKQIQQQDLDELVINYSLTSDEADQLPHHHRRKLPLPGETVFRM